MWMSTHKAPGLDINNKITINVEEVEV